MNEYTARIKSFAASVSEVRSVSGSTATTLMFALMSLLLSKNKITNKDLEIIFDVEIGQSLTTMKGFFDASYGDPDFEIKNEIELKDAEKYIYEYLNDIKDNILNTAIALNPKHYPPKTKPETKVETKVEKPKPKRRKKDEI